MSQYFDAIRKQTSPQVESSYDVVGHCMTSDVFGVRRAESLHGLGYDLTRGSFEEIRVKVTFPITCESNSLQNIDAHLSLFFTSRNDAKMLCHDATREAFGSHGCES